MAIYVRRYHNCTPLLDHTGAHSAYTTAGGAIAVTNDTEGILKVTITNPARPQEPMKEYILDVQPGTTTNFTTGLTDRDGNAITADSELVAIVEGQTVPEFFSAAAAL
jgi:hypothetical protein